MTQGTGEILHGVECSMCICADALLEAKTRSGFLLRWIKAKQYENVVHWAVTACSGAAPSPQPRSTAACSTAAPSTLVFESSSTKYSSIEYSSTEHNCKVAILYAMHYRIAC
jgi:hypothetical protein